MTLTLTARLEDIAIIPAALETLLSLDLLDDENRPLVLKGTYLFIAAMRNDMEVAE